MMTGFTNTPAKPITIQHRLYIINKAGTGEAHYIVLTPDHSDILSYNVKTDHWKITKDICNFGVAEVDNLLYIFGGYNKRSARHLDACYRYNPFEGTWTTLPSMPRPRAKFSTNVMKGKIIVTGGELPDGRQSVMCDMFDPVKNTWKELRPLLSPRSNHACAVFNEELYCAGGCNGNQFHNNLWIYEGQKWQELDKEYPQKLPVNLDRFAMVKQGRSFYFIGGVSCKRDRDFPGRFKFVTERRIFSYATSVSALEETQSDTMSSRLVSPWCNKLPTMTFARHSAGVAAIGHKIYVFGGSVLETGQQVRLVECFNTATAEWEDDFRFRKGDVSNVTCVVLEVPNKQDDEQVHYKLKWVLW